MKYAYNHEGMLVDVTQTHPDIIFNKGYASQFIEVPDECENGWLWDGGKWAAPVEPVPTIEELKSAKLAAIREEKSRVLYGGFYVNDVLFDSDLVARTAYLELEAQLRLDPEFTTLWKASEGQWVEMNADVLTSLIPVYREHVQSCFTWQAEREHELAAATTKEEIDAISEFFSHLS